MKLHLYMSTICACSKHPSKAHYPMNVGIADWVTYCVVCSSCRSATARLCLIDALKFRDEQASNGGSTLPFVVVLFYSFFFLIKRFGAFWMREKPVRNCQD